MEKGKEGKGVFFKEAPGVADFVNVVDSHVIPQVDLMNTLFLQMDPDETIKEPLKTLHGVVWAVIQTWEKISGEALKLEAEKKGAAA